MRAIADNGRFVLAGDDRRLLFIERRGLIPAWAIFVVGLLTAILAVNSVALIAYGIAVGDARLGAGLGLLVAAGLAGRNCAALVRRRRARNERGLDPTEAIVVLDLAAGVLRDAAGRELAALEQVRFVRRFQMTSSSRALHVVWPRGERVVYRGDPFSGPIDPATDELARRGITVG